MKKYFITTYSYDCFKGLHTVSLIGLITKVNITLSFVGIESTHRVIHNKMNSGTEITLKEIEGLVKEI